MLFFCGTEVCPRTLRRAPAKASAGSFVATRPVVGDYQALRCRLCCEPCREVRQRSREPPQRDVETTSLSLPEQPRASRASPPVHQNASTLSYGIRVIRITNGQKRTADQAIRCLVVRCALWAATSPRRSPRKDAGEVRQYQRRPDTDERDDKPRGSRMRLSTVVREYESCDGERCGHDSICVGLGG
jgi:hypothetical protein